MSEFHKAVSDALALVREREGCVLIFADAENQHVFFRSFMHGDDLSEFHGLAADLLGSLASTLAESGYLLNAKGNPFGSGEL